MYISDVQYLYIRRPISYKTSNIYIRQLKYKYLTSARARARARLGQGYPTSEIYISDIGYRYWTSDIYNGCPIYISEILVSFCLKRRLIELDLFRPYSV